MTAKSFDSTQEPSGENAEGETAGSTRPEPGLILICLAGQPTLAVIPLGTEEVEIGRGLGVLSEHPDSLMSRRHALAAYRNGRFEVTDLGSRNGSRLDGIALQGTRQVAERTLVRLGDSLFICCSDVRPFRHYGVKVNDQKVEGPASQKVLRTVAEISGASRTLFITGESGSGKESIAQAFHRASPQRSGPFVAVNCAAIPEGIAERLLFGARKGAFSGAASDSEGYLEAAHGGTLFLDEIADLDPVVQGKLLRVIESGELLPLGATRPRKVQCGVCSATHKDLRSLVEKSAFRADLYFRIGMPQVSVPPLRQRQEEFPWLILKAVQSVAPGLKVDVSLVEACLLRGWPGNVRELQAEVSTAALTARADSDARVKAEHLRPGAGAPMQQVPSVSPVMLAPVPAIPVSGGTPLLMETDAVAMAEKPPPGLVAEAESESPGQPPPTTEPPSRAQILAALLESKGNVSAAARAVRVHRTQFRRLLARYNIDMEKLRAVGKL